MKNCFLLLLSIVVLFSCSSGDDSNDSGSNLINPPSWIQGQWAQVNEDPYMEIPAFKFTSDDFCTIASTLETCLKEPLEQSMQAGGDIGVDENITDTKYEFTVNAGLGQSSSYEFRKISSTEIEYINSIQGVPNTYLIKQ